MSRDLHFRDSDIGKQRRESLSASHLAKSRNDLSHPSVGGHVEEIGESTGISDTGDSKDRGIVPQGSWSPKI
jgi:hypothetical protein